MALTTINIPSQVLTYADLATFPVTGANNTIYIAEDTNTAYYWDGAAYIVLGTAGGNQDLQSVTDQGNTTTNDINLDNSAIVLENSSRLQSGTVNNGAGGGIARVCSIGYQDEWENGIQYFIDQNSGQIIRANSINNTTPGINDDITIGYIVGSIFFDMNTQNKYICTDNTNGAAVWDSFIDEPQNLQEVTDQGAITTNTIYVGDLSTAYSEISNGAVGTSNVNNSTYAYIGQDAILGLHNGDVESQLKNTNVSAVNNVILEFPDKTSGSYTIATLDDIPPAQVQSDWNQSDNTDPSYILNKPNITAATNYGLFAQTANSTAITGTNVETTLINGGVGSLSVPANGFTVGDSFRAVVAGVLSTANNQTIRIRVKSGSVILLDSGAQPITNITNDVFSLNVDFTIRALGAPGVASIVSLGTFHYHKTSNAAVQGFAFNVVNNTTFNTTISNTLNITVQWGSNNAGNSIFSDIFILNKIY
jgi:hypothetical protein